VIQSISTILKEVVGEMYLIFYTFANISKLQSFYSDVTFIVVMLNFNTMETSLFNIILYVNLLLYLQWKKQILHFG
jgi:hypothetical protein